MAYHTSLRIKDLKNIIADMCPVKIFINKDCVWDDDTGTIDEYNTVLESGKFITMMTFEIVHFHHSIVYIGTL